MRVCMLLFEHQTHVMGRGLVPRAPRLDPGGVPGQFGLHLLGLGRAEFGVARRRLPPVAVRPADIATVLVARGK